MLSSWGHDELLCYFQLLGHTEMLGYIELLRHTKLLGHTEILSHIELIKTKETPVKTYLITIIGSVLIFKYNLKHFIVSILFPCMSQIENRLMFRQ